MVSSLFNFIVPAFLVTNILLLIATSLPGLDLVNAIIPPIAPSPAASLKGLKTPANAADIANRGIINFPIAAPANANCPGNVAVNSAILPIKVSIGLKVPTISTNNPFTCSNDFAKAS